MNGFYATGIGMGGRESAEIIHSYFPEAKLLVTLRDPVARVYSHYWHDRLLSQYDIEDRERFPATFEEAVDNSNLLFVGKYVSQLRAWLDFFPLDRFCFVLDIDLKKDRLATLKSVFRFLQVDPTFIPHSLDIRVNTAARHHPLYLKMLDTVNLLKKKGLAGFFDFTRLIGLNRHIQKAGMIAAPNPPIDPGTERELRRYYLEDMRALETLLGRNLKKWKTGRRGAYNDK